MNGGGGVALAGVPVRAGVIDGRGRVAVADTVGVLVAVGIAVPPAAPP